LTNFNDNVNVNVERKTISQTPFRELISIGIFPLARIALTSLRSVREAGRSEVGLEGREEGDASVRDRGGLRHP
jgi:hypothetical protein